MVMIDKQRDSIPALGNGPGKRVTQYPFPVRITRKQ
jgi:hypothetical protein